jgi:hypothetical protein
MVIGPTIPSGCLPRRLLQGFGIDPVFILYKAPSRARSQMTLIILGIPRLNPLEQLVFDRLKNRFRARVFSLSGPKIS